MQTLNKEIESFKTRTGSMLVAAGAYSRIYARNYFSKMNFELTPEQFVILEVLMEHDGLYQRQLCEITMKDRPNMTRIVNILENAGYVTRVSDKNKRRIYKIFLTNKARANYPAMHDALIKIRSVIAEGINKKDMDVCLNVLNKVLNNLLNEVNMYV